MKPADDPHLLSGAYALHSVTGDEAAEVEAAMANSEELRGEVAELSDTAVLLGLSVPPEEPPAGLRGRLLDLIADTPQLPAATVATPEAQPAPVAEPRPASVAHVAPRRRSRLRRPSVLLALAAVAVLLFGGGLLVDRVVQGSTTQNQAFVQLTQASDVQRAEASVAGGGTATVYWSDRLGESAVVLNGVDRPSGKALQLWRVTGTTAVSAGLYRPANGEHYRMLKGSFTPKQALAVTVEPPGGSPQPTTKPIVVVPTT